MLGEPGRVTIRERQQSRCGSRGQRQHAPRLTRGLRRLVVTGDVDDVLLDHGGERGLFDQHVGVGAGEPEGAHPGEARPAARVPRGRRVDDPHGQGLPGNVRIGFVEVQVLRQQLVLQRQHDLDQAGHAGGGLEVPDVGLRRAHQQWPVRVATGTVDGGRRLNLDRVAERGAGAVCLEIVDVWAGQSGAGEGRGDEALLCTAVGHRQTAGSTVLIDCAAADHRADPVAVATGVAEPLEYQHTAALATHVAVGGGVEGLAPPVGGEHAGPGCGDHRRRAEQDVDATGQGHVAVAGVQRLSGLMDGDQG